MSGEKGWIARPGRTHVRSDCLTCGEMPNPWTGAHNQRAWARAHASNNPDHQVRVETTHTRIYTHPMTLTAHGEPRCPHVAASKWGPARCVLPEGHTGRHAYGPTEGEGT